MKYDGLRPTFKKNDEDKSWEELVEDLKKLRDINSKQKESMERRKGQETLCESDEMFKQIINASPIPMVVYREEKIYHINKKFVETFGYTMEDIPSIAEWWPLAYPDKAYCEFVKNRWYAAVDEAVKNKTSIVPQEAMVTCKDGSKKDVLGFFSSIGNMNLAILQDITESKRAEESLKLNQFALDKYNDSAIWLSPDGRVIYVNETACNRLGYSREELLSMHIWDIDPNYPPDKYHEALQELIRHGILKFESKHITSEGKVIPVEVTTSYIKYRNKEYLTSFDRDITERKRAEEALRESEERFRQLADNSPIPMAINDKNDNITYLNKKFIEIFGYTLKDIPHLMYWWFLAYPDPVYREDAIKRWEKGVEEAVKESREIGPIDYTVTCKDGTVRYTEISGVSIGDKELVLLQDVTERKRAEEALRKSEANLARAQRIAHLGNWTWDTKRDMVKGSIEFLRMFGFEERDYITYDEFMSRVHSEDRESVNRAVNTALYRGAPYIIDYRVVLSDGLERVIHAEGEVIRDKADQPVQMFGTVQDITEIKRADEALREAKKQAELYLDLMGHDINNLNQIALGYLELAIETVKDDEVRDIVKKPLDAIQNSSKLIENVRKLQKVKTGGLKIEVIDLNGLLAELRNQYLNVPGKDVAIDYEPCRDCNVMANGLLRDVFSNLIWNAIKHSGPSKSVWIGMGLEHVEWDGSDYCKVVVEDDGPGIPDMLKENVFERFRKETAKARGKGLGLYLVKSLVEDFNGTVHVEDRVHGDYMKGAKFVVMLPSAEK